MLEAPVNLGWKAGVGEELTRDSNGGAEDFLGGGDGRRLTRGGPEAQHHPWEVALPVRPDETGMERSFEVLVEPLNQAICLGMVGSCLVVADAQQEADFLPEC